MAYFCSVIFLLFYCLVTEMEYFCNSISNFLLHFLSASSQFILFGVKPFFVSSIYAYYRINTFLTPPDISGQNTFLAKNYFLEFVK